MGWAVAAAQERIHEMVDKDKAAQMDAHWKEVMDLAEQYGFIAQAAGGTAILLTHRNQIEADGRRSICIDKGRYSE